MAAAKPEEVKARVATPSSAGGGKDVSRQTTNVCESLPGRGSDRGEMGWHIHDLE